jgi:hypothetical protein
LQPDHRVLPRAVCSPLHASRRLLRWLVAVFVPWDDSGLGRDDPSTRRRGQQSTATGISRDPVRSSHAHCVPVSRWRWLRGVGSCPRWRGPTAGGRCRFGPGCVPRHASRRPVDVTRSACSGAGVSLPRALLRVPRVPPGPQVGPDSQASGAPLAAVVGDAPTAGPTRQAEQGEGEGPRELAVSSAPAGGYHAGKPPGASRWGLMRAPHERCKPPAWLATTLAHPPAPLLPWCGRRWPLDGPGAAARAHRGRETPRPWPERASPPSTPTLWRLAAMLTWTAPLLIAKGGSPGRRTAGYAQTSPTFAAALAWGRRHVWEPRPFSTAQQQDDRINMPRTFCERLMDVMSYAA